ncbi:chitosanase [Microlunatus panaciterrae]|uniref:Chitosanase n=1 Tax=Microlunatus panaciterrae TaxID=400768 RepID=A0ABS2RN33_9ACTN|nr:chitosanase [Microlunatus panaciterrae]MBM7799992.1 chitosanase [Microlunatus panaciterrae]
MNTTRQPIGHVTIFSSLLTASAVLMAGAAAIAVPATSPYDASKPTVTGRATVAAASTQAIQLPGASSTPMIPHTSRTSAADLSDPAKKDIAMQLVSSAENSSLDWKAQYAYIEDIGDGRGYTAGIIGFCTGCGDLLRLVQEYNRLVPGNVLTKYIPALERIGSRDGTHAGLDPNFITDWKTAAEDPQFQRAQRDECDRGYFNPAVAQGRTDGLHALGQFFYYDALVMHGRGDDPISFGGIRATAMKKVKTPAQGGDEAAYLNAFLDARKAAMLTEAAHDDTSRVDTEQRVFLQAGNLDLDAPLTWQVYGDRYTIK